MRVVVQWPRFGPYHLARLRAFHALCEDRGSELVALETASQDRVYEWREETEPEAFRREQVFPGHTYESVPGPEMQREVTRALDRLAPDVVVAISYATPDARAALAWCRQNRRGLVMISEARADDAPRQAWREAVKRALLQTADAALVPGTVHADYLTSLGISAEQVFSPASVVDNEYFRRGSATARARPESVRSFPGLGEAEPYFLSSGRFIKRKGLPTLLRAYAAYRLRSEAPWGLVLLGDGVLRHTVEQLAAETSGVTLAGFRQVEDLPVYYGLAAAYVHPAEADQWGLVVNEAMASGLPVIVSQGAGCAPDLVRPGVNGWTVPAGDDAALTDALLRMERADRQALGQASHDIIDAYTPQAFAEGLWAATQAARARANRPFPLHARLLLKVLRLAARSTSSFHTVEA